MLLATLKYGFVTKITEMLHFISQINDSAKLCGLFVDVIILSKVRSLRFL